MDTNDTRHAGGAGTQTGHQAPKSRKPTQQEIVYTQPKPFHAKKFFLRLLIVVAVVLALTFGMTIFFKIDTVTVSGTEKYTAWEVKEASGIQEGENLLTQSKARISGKIKTSLPYVATVRVGIALPGTINIEITELEVVYAIESEDGSWWLMSADGRLIERTGPVQAQGYTQVLGVKLSSPAAGAQAAAAELSQTAEGEETVQVVTRESERLQTAVSILGYLESNGVIGQAASVDVSDLSRIRIWYEDRYQVNLGDTTQLAYKIQCMKKVIDQEKEYQSGILDVSFTTWPDQVGYTPMP